MATAVKSVFPRVLEHRQICREIAVLLAGNTSFGKDRNLETASKAWSASVHRIKWHFRFFECEKRPDTVTYGFPWRTSHTILTHINVWLKLACKSVDHSKAKFGAPPLISCLRTLGPSHFMVMRVVSDTWRTNFGYVIILQLIETILFSIYWPTCWRSVAPKHC